MRHESMQRLVPQTLDFSGAPLFRKRTAPPKARVRFAIRQEPVVTRIGGVEETRNIAEPGDAIVEGAQGELYVIAAEAFAKLYAEDPADPSRYIARNVVRAIRLDQDAEIDAPWGETQRTTAGGWVVQSVTTGDVYLIDGNAFETSYEAV